MDRRAFIGALTGGLLAAPLAAEAQPAGKLPMLGVLHLGPGGRTLSVDTVRKGLRELGYVEGKTIVVEIRLAGGKSEAFRDLAADLVRRKVDVLFASGPAAVRAARDATSTIPIVALDLESDPVQAGFARSFAQPGGNITGCFLDQSGLTGKWLELIGEATSGAHRVAVLVDPATGPWQLAAVKTAAERRGMELQILEVRGLADLESALGAAVKAGSRGLVQLSSPIFDNDPAAKRTAVKHRLPTISMFTRFVKAGGLMSYGPDQPQYYGRLAGYIDKILKGAQPGDLPIKQPTTFELVINLKTAKALGLTIPPSLLQRADQVIE